MDKFLKELEEGFKKKQPSKSDGKDSNNYLSDDVLASPG
jgi:hypothetical protein